MHLMATRDYYLQLQLTVSTHNVAHTTSVTLVSHATPNALSRGRFPMPIVVRRRARTVTPLIQRPTQSAVSCRTLVDWTHHVVCISALETAVTHTVTGDCPFFDNITTSPCFTCQKDFESVECCQEDIMPHCQAVSDPGCRSESVKTGCLCPFNVSTAATSPCGFTECDFSGFAAVSSSCCDSVVSHCAAETDSGCDETMVQPCFSTSWMFLIGILTSLIRRPHNNQQHYLRR